MNTVHSKGALHSAAKVLDMISLTVAEGCHDICLPMLPKAELKKIQRAGWIIQYLCEDSESKEWECSLIADAQEQLC